MLPKKRRFQKLPSEVSQLVQDIMFFLKFRQILFKASPFLPEIVRKLAEILIKISIFPLKFEKNCTQNFDIFYLKFLKNFLTLPLKIPVGQETVKFLQVGILYKLCLILARNVDKF